MSDNVPKSRAVATTIMAGIVEIRQEPSEDANLPRRKDFSPQSEAGPSGFGISQARVDDDRQLFNKNSRRIGQPRPVDQQQRLEKARQDSKKPRTKSPTTATASRNDPTGKIVSREKTLTKLVAIPFALQIDNKPPWQEVNFNFRLTGQVKSKFGQEQRYNCTGEELLDCPNCKRHGMYTIASHQDSMAPAERNARRNLSGKGGEEHPYHYCPYYKCNCAKCYKYHIAGEKQHIGKITPEDEVVLKYDENLYISIGEHEAIYEWQQVGDKIIKFLKSMEGKEVTSAIVAEFAANFKEPLLDLNNRFEVIDSDRGLHVANMNLYSRVLDYVENREARFLIAQMEKYGVDIIGIPGIGKIIERLLTHKKLKTVKIRIACYHIEIAGKRRVIAFEVRNDKKECIGKFHGIYGTLCFKRPLRIRAILTRYLDNAELSTALTHGIQFCMFAEYKGHIVKATP
ncbi:hypothetical protein HDE_09498 [Halotydeus destructor]|nr:hypothetical protein HDE_09498 [Halotydeus destructor]